VAKGIQNVKGKLQVLVIPMGNWLILCCHSQSHPVPVIETTAATADWYTHLN
jgi:hypothetical protein